MTQTKTSQDYAEVSQSIKSIFDLTSRIDERVKLIMRKQDQMEEKLDERLANIHELEGRLRLVESNKEDIEKEVESLRDTVHNMELGLQAVEIQTEGHEGKWKTIISFAVQIAWVILAAYLLMKLGIQAPAVP